MSGKKIGTGGKVVTLSLALLALTAQGARGVPPGAAVVVDGTVNTHGAPPGTVDGSISATAGQNGTSSAPLDPITPYTYQAPTIDGSTSVGTLPSTITGSGSLTVIEAGPTTLSNPTVVIGGGGIVMIHVTGNLTLDGGTFTVTDGTRVVFFVDGKTTFNYTKLQQLGTGSSLQIQGRGDVTVKADQIQGVAFANQTLTLDASGAALGALRMDESRLSAAQEGIQYVKVLPILDGER